MTEPLFDMPPPHPYSLTQLRGRHDEILRYHLLGLSNKDISELLNITPQCVCDTLSSPIAQYKLADLRASRDTDTVDVAKEIANLQPRAVELLAKVIAGDPDLSPKLRDRIDAAKDMLDRGGNSKVNKVSASFTGYVGSVGIEAIKQRARELGLISGTVVEATFQEVSNG